jgi:hypothetical protein
MRHSFRASATARVFAAAVLAAGGLFLAADSSPVNAYSGAQAEAQMDPVSDPYGFPNIKLCCGEQKKKKKWRYRHRDRDWDRDPDYNDWYHHERRPSGRRLFVSCGRPEHRTYSSIGEALEHAREGARIIVLPGAPCSISGLTIDQGVSIESDDHDGGGRATLYGQACANVSPPYGQSVVSFRGVDIEGCLVGRGGKLELNRVNVAWRGDGDAIKVLGGSLVATESTVRAKEGAINAEQAGLVSATGSRFASGPKSYHVVRLNVGSATFKDTLIKGGKVGVYVDMQGRYPVTFNRVEVKRGDASEIRRHGPGEAGIMIGGGESDDDLPSLPDMPSAEFFIEDSTVAGYGDGLRFGGGVKGNVRRVTIAYPARGITANAGATLDLRENRIVHARKAGFDLESGVLGGATLNDIQCDDGYCVCYGGDCTSRSEREFGKGAFRMTGTRCDD